MLLSISGNSHKLAMSALFGHWMLLLSGCGNALGEFTQAAPTTVIVNSEGQMLAAIDARLSADPQVFSLRSNRTSSAIINTMTAYSHNVELQSRSVFAVLSAFPQGPFQALLDIDPATMEVVRRTDLDMRPVFLSEGLRLPYSPDFHQVTSFGYSGCTAIGGGDFVVGVPHVGIGDGAIAIRRDPPPFYLDNSSMCRVGEGFLILVAAQSEDSGQHALYRFCFQRLETLPSGYSLCESTHNIQIGRLDRTHNSPGPGANMGAILPNNDLLVATLETLWLIPVAIACDEADCEVALDGEPLSLYSVPEGQEGYLIELTIGENGRTFALQELIMHGDDYVARALVFQNSGDRVWSMTPVEMSPEEHELRFIRGNNLMVISGRGRGLSGRTVSISQRASGEGE